MQLYKMAYKTKEMKKRYQSLSLIFLFTALVGCKSSEIKNSIEGQTGLTKVAIFYPNGQGKTFDMTYYENKHMPMVAGFLGENLKFYEIDKGISGRTPNDEVPFLAVGYFYVHDLAAYNAAIGPHIDAIVNDFKNYTNIQPVIQISEIQKVGYNNKK